MLNKSAVSKGRLGSRIKTASLIASGVVFFVPMANAQGAANPAEPAPIVTAPSIKPKIWEAGGPSSAVTTTPLQVTAPQPAVAAAVEDDFAWVLQPNQHPWPLRYMEGAPLNHLYINVPSAQELRIMFPGMASDEAFRLRREVEKYITNSLGIVTQQRNQQLELVREWIARSQEQKGGLEADPWKAYQFSKELYAQLRPFREKVEAQSAPAIEFMVGDVQALVSKVSPLLAVMSSYELQMAWYNSMKQLKDGVALFHAQATEGDKKVLQLLDQFEAANPPVSLPQGPKPKRMSNGNTPQLQPDIGGRTVVDLKAPEKTLAQPAPLSAAQEDTGSSFGGVIVLLGMAAAVLGLFLNLHRKVKGRMKKPAAE